MDWLLSAILMFMLCANVIDSTISNVKAIIAAKSLVWVVVSVFVLACWPIAVFRVASQLAHLGAFAPLGWAP